MAEKRAIVIADMGGGGSQRVVRQLAEDWLASGHDVAVITLSSSDTDQIHLPSLVRRFALDCTGGSANLFAGLFSNLRRVRRIRAAIRESGADQVVSFLAATNVLSILACRGLSVRLTVSERNDPARQPLGRVWELLRRRIYRRADCVTANSKQALRSLSSYVPEARLHYVPNPIPIWHDVAKHPGGREAIILAVGRLHRQKGYDLMLPIFAASKAKALGWRLVILGEGSERSALQAQARDLEISDAVEMPGHCDSVREWYDRAGLFMMTSRYEGMPNAVLEAISRGLPVLVSETCGDASALVQNAECGLLIDPSQVDASARQLDRLLDERELRRALSSNGMAMLVEEFSLERVRHLWERALGRNLRDVAT